MKKLWFLLCIPILAVAAILVYQNLPQKRFARHLIKARLYTQEGNYTAAQLEYEKAYNTSGEYTPWVSFEVLQLMNRKSLQDKNLPEALANTRRFVQEHPENVDGRLTLAELAFQAQEPDAAFEALNALLERAPENFRARLLLTRVRTMQGRLDLAEEQLRYLYRQNPDSVNALLPLAENLLKQGKTAEARKFIAGILADHPGNNSARLLLVDAYLLDRNLDSAQSVLQAWQATADSSFVRPVAVRRAQLHVLAGKYAEAERILAPYADITEENARVVAEIALIKASKGEYDSAAMLYTRLGETLPAWRGETLRMTIYLHLKALSPAKALEAIKILQVGNRNASLSMLTLACYQALGQEKKSQDFIAAQPDSLQEGLRQAMTQWLADKAYIGQWALIEYFRINGQAYKTLLAAQELYRLWPKNPAAVATYGAQLAFLRQYGAAAKLIESIPHPTPAQRMGLFTLWLHSGEREKAVGLAEKLLQENPKLPGLNSFLAEYAWSKGDREKGISLYEKELAINPDHQVALNNLAWEYGIVKKDFKTASTYLERLRSQKTQDSRIWDTMGWILARNGRLPEGEKYIRGALNMVPDYPAYLYHMGWIQAQGGKKAEAKATIESALKSQTPFGERKEAEALLAQLGQEV